MPDIAEARASLLSQILQGDGYASPGQRRAAFDDLGLRPPVSVLVSKVAQRADSVSADDITAAIKSGLTEDQIFELVVCAAVGEATRQHDAALAVLDAASAGP
jgi:hypothetical protein